jgi:copper chaperone CopZ
LENLFDLVSKKALEHVSGVQQVAIDYASKTAAAGYPSTLKETLK